MYHFSSLSPHYKTKVYIEILFQIHCLLQLADTGNFLNESCVICQITTYADSKFNFGHLEIKFHNLKLNTDHNLSCCFKMKALCYHYDNINPHLNQVPFLLKYKILNLLAKKSTNIQFIMCLIIFSISVWILQCTSLSKAKNCL